MEKASRAGQEVGKKRIRTMVEVKKAKGEKSGNGEEFIGKNPGPPARV